MTPRKPHRYTSPHWTPLSLTTPTISSSILFRRCSVSLHLYFNIYNYSEDGKEIDIKINVNTDNLSFYTEQRDKINFKSETSSVGKLIELEKIKVKNGLTRIQFNTHSSQIKSENDPRKLYLQIYDIKSE